MVQEKYQEEKACDNRHPYHFIIIIIVLNIKLSQISVGVLFYIADVGLEHNRLKTTLNVRKDPVRAAQ